MGPGNCDFGFDIMPGQVLHATVVTTGGGDVTSGSIGPFEATATGPNPLVMTRTFNPSAITQSATCAPCMGSFVVTLTRT